MQHQLEGFHHITAAESALSVPAGYEQVNERLATQDGLPVRIVRYERADRHNRGLGGEHFTIVTETQTNQVQGMTWMAASLTDSPLPSRDEARRTAKAFLANVAPDLAGTLTVLWIEPHDETLVADGKSVTVTGMKVKCRQSSGKYAWVIVASDECVITFERDIVWNFDMSMRMTEKWLHDAWLQENQDSPAA